MNSGRISYYPAFINLAGKSCVVVGGGEVALRKANALLEREAEVTVISPEVCPELTALANEGRIRISPRRYRSGDLDGAFLVISATDNRQTNGQVAGDAATRNVLVNVVDDAALSSFIVPSSFKRGDVVVAVSTSGRGPALARKIRTKLEAEFGEEYDDLARLVDEVRSDLKRRGTSADAEAWQTALDVDSLLGLLRQGKTAEARNLLVKNLKGVQFLRKGMHK
jgi:siroheme synthase-like protein